MVDGMEPITLVLGWAATLAGVVALLFKMMIAASDTKYAAMVAQKDAQYQSVVSLYEARVTSLKAAFDTTLAELKADCARELAERDKRIEKLENVTLQVTGVAQGAVSAVKAQTDAQKPVVSSQ